MWRNPSNNYDEYFREDRERESSQWRIQTPMESYNHSAPETSEEQPSNAQDEPGPSQDRSVLYQTDRRTDRSQTFANDIHRDRPWTDRSQSNKMTGPSQDRPFSLETEYPDRPFQLQTGRSDPRPAVPIMDQVWTESDSFNNDAFYQPPPYFQCQNEEMGYEWSNECQYYPSNEEMNYIEEYGYQQESFNPNLYYRDSSNENHQEYANPEMTSILQQLLEDQERGDKEIKEAIEEMEYNIDRSFKETSERLDHLTLRYESLKAKVEIEEASKYEDMDEDIGTWNSFPKEYNVVDEQQLQCLYEDDEESIQFQEDEPNEDVQDAQVPLKEEIEEVPKDAEMTQEGEVVEVFFPYFEIVVEHQEDPFYTQQQSPAGDEVEEFIQFHGDSPDEDALASIVAVMNEETLRLNKASIIYEKNKEEEEVVQIFELPQTELHQDEAVEPQVPGTPTPRLKYPQGLRKRLEWRIKHKWKIKPRNV